MGWYARLHPEIPHRMPGVVVINKKVWRKGEDMDTDALVN